MKRFFTIFASLLLFSASVGMTNAGAVDFGKLGGVLKDKVVTGNSNSASAGGGSIGGGSAPTLQQMKSDPDYANVSGNYYYKKSSVKVLSKSPDWKVHVTVFDFVSDFVGVQDYELECVYRQGGGRADSPCSMKQKLLGAKNYRGGQQTTTTGAAGERDVLYKSTDLGALAGILYKQTTGKTPPVYY